jgi:hypothetical protein
VREAACRRVTADDDEDDLERLFRCSDARHHDTGALCVL